MRNTFQKGVSHSILPEMPQKTGISHTFIMHFSYRNCYIIPT